MTWVDYVDDVLEALRPLVKVDYVTHACTGTDGHMGSPVEERFITAPVMWQCKIRQRDPIPTVVEEIDANGCTIWRADLLRDPGPEWHDGHGCGDFWLCTYEITEG